MGILIFSVSEKTVLRVNIFFFDFSPMVIGQKGGIGKHEER